MPVSVDLDGKIASERMRSVANLQATSFDVDRLSFDVIVESSVNKHISLDEKEFHSRRVGVHEDIPVTWDSHVLSISRQYFIWPH